MPKIVLILGAGPNIRLNINARVFEFSSKGQYVYKTVIVSRNPKEELMIDIIKEAHLSITADFTNPDSIKNIFDEVKQKFGVANAARVFHVPAAVHQVL